MRIDKSKLVIRKAASDDSDEMKVIAREVGVKNYTPFLGEKNVSDYLESGLLEKDIYEHLDNTVVCEYESQIVGMCAFWDDFVHVLLVKHAFQGNGIGKMVIEYAETKLFENNTRIWLKTFENNTDTIVFYVNNGWKSFGKEYSANIGGYYLKLEKTKPEAVC